jgi:nicotinamide phosphoribosyltransferase
VCVNGTWRDIQKDPITDPGKKSKAGRVKLFFNGVDYVSSVNAPLGWTDKGSHWRDALEEVFRDGKLVREMNFEEIRSNSNK